MDGPFPAAGGARAWIRVPISGMDISIQPSEFAKVMVILIVAAYCGDVKKVFDNSSDIVKRPAVFIFAYFFIVLLLQSDKALQLQLDRGQRILDLMGDLTRHLAPCIVSLRLCQLDGGVG